MREGRDGEKSHSGVFLLTRPVRGRSATELVAQPHRVDRDERQRWPRNSDATLVEAKAAWWSSTARI
ncbi:putative vegetative cell wall protein gp1-like isoform X5 [Iris pallida]|uniref:Vegetative cell wall protein gp1-like isoform X5 n=1 Tax=Iris pallida TaxID=29817 RepID=A0AAX6G9H9_IRIPA|nr:putative vegetative cell wall protein gp1-like isoform X5 [Iris pallida]